MTVIGAFGLWTNHQMMNMFTNTAVDLEHIVPIIHRLLFTAIKPRKRFSATVEQQKRVTLNFYIWFHITTTKQEWSPTPQYFSIKKTNDAHDNPVISVDEKGYIWIFSASHGTSRPSYIHKSKKPFDINSFELIHPLRKEDSKEIPMNNFSYIQPWFVPNRGFITFFTLYRNPALRTSFFMTSPDGVKWTNFTRLSAIEEGHYQISAVSQNKAGTTFNFHPEGKGVNWRTNLYYMETNDWGKTWQTVEGENLSLPLTEIKNPALVHNYQSEGLLVYLIDIVFNEEDNPIILYITSNGYESGPKNDPRTWTTARWTGNKWEINKAMTSDNNYDMGSLYIEDDGTWRLIAPTETGPQPYNTGGEMAMWVSKDSGKLWKMVKQLTKNSEFNHTYARRPVNAHPDFYAIWADGHARKPSQSSLYFCSKDGTVKILPREMKSEFEKPKILE